MLDMLGMNMSPGTYTRITQAISKTTQLSWSEPSIPRAHHERMGHSHPSSASVARPPNESHDVDIARFDGNQHVFQEFAHPNNNSQRLKLAIPRNFK